MALRIGRASFMVNLAHAGRKELTTLLLTPRDAGAGATSASLDMEGYDRVKFIAAIGAMNSGGTFDLRAIESDNSNLSGNTNIPNAAIVQVANTGNSNVVEIDIARPSKRYVAIVATPASANSVYSVIGVQYRGSGTLPTTLPAGSQYVVVAEN